MNSIIIAIVLAVACAFIAYLVVDGYRNLKNSIENQEEIEEDLYDD